MAVIDFGGVKENVLPRLASAVVNCRILPGDSVTGVLEHVRETVDDGRVQVRALAGAWEASAVSDSISLYLPMKRSFWIWQNTQ